MIHIYPHVPLHGDTPQNGLSIKAPSFCLKANKATCKNHYSEIRTKSGLHQCPYGFNSFVFEQSAQKYIYSGIRISGKHNKEKTSRALKNEYSPHIPLDHFIESLETTYKALLQTNKQLEEFNSVKSIVEKIQDEQTEDKDFIVFVVHEIRKLNAAIKRQAEEINRKLDQYHKVDERFIRYRSENIFATSSLISVRLNAYDIHENPHLIFSQGKKDTAVYKKFEKVKHCLQAIANSKNITIHLNGTSYSSVEAYSLFDILPFVLIENAIKYSPDNQIIDIDFFETHEILTIKISSFGPIVDEDELERIFEKKYRGRNADTITEGTGIGLYLARQICNVHDITISASSDKNNSTNINGSPFAKFSIVLEIPRMLI